MNRIRVSFNSGEFRRLMVFVSFVLLIGCESEPALNKPIKLSGPIMGTTYHVTAYPDRANVTHLTWQKNPADLRASVHQALEEINQRMSTYIPESELSQLSQAEIGVCVPLSELLFEVVAESMEISQKSQGFFDITVGPAVQAWGFGWQKPESMPSESLLAALPKQIGYLALELNKAQRCLVKHQPRALDLSAIAKGYAVDRVAKHLRAQGFTQFLVEVGGEIWVEQGKPLETPDKSTEDRNQIDRGSAIDAADNVNKQPWLIAVEAPLKDQHLQVHRALAITQVGVATSGDYRNFYEKDGKAYSHTIDPHTARPVEHHLVSVTVIADSAMKADGWATALLSMGRERAMTVIEQLDLAVLMIERIDGSLVEYQSKAFKPYVEVIE